MKKPEITRENNVVLIKCPDENSAITCEKEIRKVLNNRMLLFMMKRHTKR